MFLIGWIRAAVMSIVRSTANQTGQRRMTLAMSPALKQRTQMTAAGGVKVIQSRAVISGCFQFN